jgi:energy-coupling factor transporter ATP-binding protein EcfA2
MHSISPFDNFNARYSTQEEIASTFVSNEDFFSIAKNNHTFVLGPRGCGKTTVFKMLTSIAIKKWVPKNIAEKDLKDNFPFIAIYIPSDDLWKDQLEALLSNLEIENKLEFNSFVENALITINILSNFCTSIIKHITTLELESQNEKEYEFSDLLIKYWKIEDCFPSLISIKNELENRKSNFIQKVNKFLFNKQHGLVNNVDFETFYYSDFMNDLKSSIIGFERVYYNGNEQKWALCFDELELVSNNFCKNLLKKLRISPSNIVFKLSSGPLTDFIDNIAQAFHDYQIVKMWPNNIKEEEKYIHFCEKIAEERILYYRRIKNLKKFVSIDFTRLFGTLDYSKLALKDFKFDIDLRAAEEEPKSETWYAFRELAKSDFTLVKEMDKRGINPENPIPRTKNNYDSFIRKTKEIVINRLVFSKLKDIGSNSLSRRTRKEYPIYYGKETIFKICEGNPRFIMNIIDDLIIKSNKYFEIEDETFSPIEQTEVIKNVSVRFSAMLNTFPTSTEYLKKSVDLSWLINEVGNYFEKEVNFLAFSINPATSFKFKMHDVNPNLLELLRLGIRLGAFVKVDKSIDDITHSDEDTRYRLSYLLHPSYKLPLRLYSSVNLFKIVGKDLQTKFNFKK